MIKSYLYNKTLKWGDSVKIGVKISKIILLILVTFCWFSIEGITAKAAPARNEEFTFTQPTGEKFKAALQGDEWLNWWETKDGNIIAKGPDGAWYYGQILSDKLVPSLLKYSEGKKPMSLINRETMLKLRQNIKLNVSKENNTGSKSPSNFNIEALDNQHKLLLIVIDFSDISVLYSDSTWSDYVFSSTSNSVNNYYNEVSSGKLSFLPAEENYQNTNDGVIRVRLPYNHPNTGGNTSYLNQQIVRDALVQADSYIDFASYDKNADNNISFDELHIVTVVAGNEASYGNFNNLPSIWAHKWSLFGSYITQLDGKFLCSPNNSGYTMIGERHGDHMATIGVLCHELGHDLGLPDLYDTDNTSLGVGIHSLMAGGSWTSLYGAYPGSSPAHLDPWSKIKLDFAAPTVVNASESLTVNSIGTGQYNILKIETPNPDEYFLVENRQFEGYDKGLQPRSSSGGIALWHIDEGVIRNNIYDVNANERHKGVDIEEANEGILGYSQLDNRVQYSYNHYYYSGNNSIFNAGSKPDSRLYDGTDTGIIININNVSSPSMQVDISLSSRPLLVSSDPENGSSNMLVDKNITVSFSKKIQQGTNFNSITLMNKNKNIIPADAEISDNNLIINPKENLSYSEIYTLHIPKNSLKDLGHNPLYEDYYLSFSTLPVPSVVKINDINLENAIRTALNKYSGDITSLDMANLIDLDASHRSIEDLTGLEYAVNLRRLWVDHSNLMDIKPIENLTNMVNLNLSYNKIQELPSLINLKNLHEILLTNNALRDISKIIELVNQGGLKYGYIDISNNYLDLSQLSTTIQEIEDRGIIINYKPQKEINFPEIISTNPERDAVDVATDTVITIGFDELIQGGHNFNGISLLNNSGKVSTKLNIAGSILSIIPDKELEEKTTYSVLIPMNSIKNSDGFALKNDFSYSFKTGENIIPAASVSLNKITATLTVGASETLKATVSPEDASNKEVTWSSSDTSVATVDAQGKVTAVDAGKAVITVTTEDGNHRAQCTITVVAPKLIQSISLKSKSLKLGLNETYKILYTISPNDAENQTISWKSSDESVVTVDNEGNVKAVGKGTAKITLFSSDGSGKYAVCSVSVLPVEEISLSKINLSLKAGAKAKLTAKLSPSTAINKSIFWETSNVNIVTVDEKGNIKALTDGEAVITARAEENNEIMAQCRIVVETPVTSVKLNSTSITLSEVFGYNTAQLTAAVLPKEASNKNIKWTSSNENVAVVSSDGHITALTPGKATITAVTESGNKTAKCTVTVNTAIALSKSSITKKIGTTEKLTVKIDKILKDKKIVWTSSNEAVALVTESGKTIAVGSGTSTITANIIIEADDKEYVYSATSLVKVSPLSGVQSKVSSIIFTNSNIKDYNLTTSKGKSTTITAKVVNEKGKKPTNANLLWESSDSAIATVDENGKITTVARGTASITARATDGSGITQSLIITIN